MKLRNEDIAFIAEQRTLKISWKWLARIYGMNWKTLQSLHRNRMDAGYFVRGCK